MKTESEFKNYYETTILTQLDRQEEERNQALSVKRSAIVLIAIGLLLFNLPFLHSPFIIVSLGITSFLSFIGYRAITYKFINDYEYDFKIIIIRGIVSFLSPEMIYHPDEGINKNAFEISGIYNDRLRNFNSSDLIKGSIGDTNIQFSWCGELIQIGKAKFKGLFFIGDFNKPFQGEIYVLHRLSAIEINDMINRVEIMRPPKVTLEYNDFNDAFIVYGTDPVETRYVLTPAMMRKMLDLKQKTNDSISFSFVRGYVLV